MVKKNGKQHFAFFLLYHLALFTTLYLTKKNFVTLLSCQVDSVFFFSKKHFFHQHIIVSSIEECIVDSDLSVVFSVIRQTIGTVMFSTDDRDRRKHDLPTSLIS